MIPALRDVSLICLIVPTMLCLLIPLALLFGTNWLLRKGRRALPPRLQSVHQTLRRVDAAVDRAGEKVVRPFVAAEARVVTTRTWWRKLWQPISKAKP